MPPKAPGRALMQTNTTLDPTKTVCPHCNNLDLDDLFNQCRLTDLGIGQPLVNLKGFSIHQRKSACKTCAFLANTTPLLTSEVPETWHLRAFDYDLLRLRHEFDEGMSIVDYSRLLSRNTTAADVIRLENLVLAITRGATHDHCSQDHGQTPSHCILPVKRLQGSRLPQAYKGRPVEKKLNYAFVHAALKNCAENHDQCHTSHPSSRSVRPSHDLRVVDCENNTIVDFPGGKYAALSYTIGHKPPGHNLPSDLTSHMGWSKVIMDAVECCKNLQCRYLWVDQLCVDQNDPVKLTEAISRMHEIFSFATLTIVSLAAQQSDGLPGVGSTIRTRAPRLMTRNNVYVSTSQHLVDALQDSKWMTRGWCYQEAALSKRLLILGPHQAYFVCNSSTVFESIACALSHSSSGMDRSASSRTSPHMLAILKGATEPGSWIFGEWIAAYTARMLTYESDILSAFQGMLNNSAHQTYMGVPFVQKLGSHRRSDAAAFAIGLSWGTSYNTNCYDLSWKGLTTPTGTSAYQRSEFPSWSWASCRVFKNPITYMGSDWRSFDMETDLNGIIDHSNIAISFEDETGVEIPAADFLRKCRGLSPVLPEISRFVCIEAEATQLCMRQLEDDDTYDFSMMEQVYGEYYESMRNAAPLKTDKEIDWSSIARFCVNTEAHPNFGPWLRYYAMDPDNDEYMVDFDWPPTMKDGRNEEINGRNYLGLILFFCPWKPRDSDIESLAHRGAYCVLMCERHESRQYYTRVGRAWIPDGHIQYFPTRRQKIRLG